LIIPGVKGRRDLLYLMQSPKHIRTIHIKSWDVIEVDLLELVGRYEWIRIDNPKEVLLEKEWGEDIERNHIPSTLYSDSSLILRKRR
jgi:hypothetical protein